MLRPYFYDHGGPRAACGHTIKVAVPTEFSTDDPDSCPDCIELVESGKAWGRFKQPRFDPYWDTCDRFVRIEEEDGEIALYECTLPRWHREPHTSHGATWRSGEKDFVPAPDGYA